MLFNPKGGNSFGLVTPSWGTSRPATSMGTQITPGNGSYGTAGSFTASLNFDAYGILLNVNTGNTSGVPRALALRIGVDPSGGTSYQYIINDLLAGAAIGMTGGLGGIWYYFPIFIPAGSRVSVAGYQNNTSGLYVNAQFMQKPSSPEALRIASYCETIGATNNAGTAITPGTTSEGSWTLVGTTTKPCWWWQFAVQIDVADTAWNAGNIFCDIAVGDATNKDIILLDQIVNTTGNEQTSSMLSVLGAERDVPAGSSIYARLQHSGTVDTTTIAAYGCGG